MYDSAENAREQIHDGVRTVEGILRKSRQEFLQAGVNGLVCGALVIEGVAGLLMVGGAQGVGKRIPPHVVNADGVLVERSGDKEIGGLQFLRRVALFGSHAAQKPRRTAVADPL